MPIIKHAERIRCKYLTLGWIPTEGELKLRKAQGMNETELSEYAASILKMGRMNEKSDYMGALVYLMSDKSYMTTGSILRITGGVYL